MIIGIGTDIVEIRRFDELLARHGDAFAERILSKLEYDSFLDVADKQRSRYLAKRFAAKEAAAKAFGTGFTNGLSLKHIATVHDERGKPCLMFDKKALELVYELDIKNHHVTLSDEAHYAVAFVILES
ncbi:holo-ACP synthase [Piscirickettsia salmonis]|uniref:holo-ACP synthase n=1 Tax=Piscirickettsia salmonis TaxID=1238 RepID=UPI0007C882B1|nr:Holo-[acyl-carrier-protein] synthase [Piscirickettsiaceae bacterium NZ-RLO1]